MFEKLMIFLGAFIFGCLLIFGITTIIQKSDKNSINKNIITIDNMVLTLPNGYDNFQYLGDGWFIFELEGQKFLMYHGYRRDALTRMEK